MLHTIKLIIIATTAAVGSCPALALIAYRTGHYDLAMSLGNVFTAVLGL